MSRIHRRTLPIAAAAAALLCLPASASASWVWIGSTYAGAGCCGPGTTYIVQSTARTSPAYSVPAGGTKISAFSVQANATAGVQVRLQVFRKTGTLGVFLVVGQSVAETLAPNRVNTFPVSIKVHAGDRLGMTNVSGSAAAPIFKSGFPTRDVLGVAPGDPATGSTVPFTSHNSPTGFRLNLSAIVQVVPVVTSVSPASAAGGTVVTISGQHLTHAARVKFGSSAQLGTNVTVVSDNEITVDAPTGVAPGTTVDVRVLTPGGQSAVTPGDRFTFS